MKECRLTYLCIPPRRYCSSQVARKKATLDQGYSSKKAKMAETIENTLNLHLIHYACSPRDDQHTITDFVEQRQ